MSFWLQVLLGFPRREPVHVTGGIERLTDAVNPSETQSDLDCGDVVQARRFDPLLAEADPQLALGPVPGVQLIT